MLRLQLQAEGLTVTEAGEIELPTEAKMVAGPTDAPTTEPSAPDVTAMDPAEDPELIRKAS